MPYSQFNPKDIQVFPLQQRKHLTSLEDILVDPDSPAPSAEEYGESIQNLAAHIKKARQKGASVMLMYGAHLIRNGMGPTLIRLMEEGWITHLATNGAGIIHDWEYSFLGQSTESVRENVHTGTFGTWEETGRNINLAFIAGAAENRGLGESIGRFIQEDGVMLTPQKELLDQILQSPEDPLTAARADLLQWLKMANLPKAVSRFLIRIKPIRFLPMRTGCKSLSRFIPGLGMTSLRITRYLHLPRLAEAAALIILRLFNRC